MSEDRTLFVARESDVDALKAHWSAAQQGASKVVRLQAPFGGGRRALCADFLRQVAAADGDTVIWRVSCLDQENGLQWLVRMYGSLVAVLTRDAVTRGKVEMVLNAQLPSQEKRVQAWYQQFIAAMKEAKTDAEKGQVQLRLPQDNPLLGLVEVVAAISRKLPVILELQQPYAVNSLALSMFVEGLHHETKSGSRLMQILFDEAPSDVTRALFPMPLIDLYHRHEAEYAVQVVEAWGAAEVQKYLSSKGLQSDAARIAEIAGGRPGFVAELVDVLEERSMLQGDLAGVSFASLVPLDVAEGEIEAPAAPAAEGERTHAGPADIGRVTFLAALLGAAFPSNLVADMGGYERESVDDLLDAMKDLFEEVQFSQELDTWIYRFKRGCYREGVIERNQSDEGVDLAQRVGMFMERYLVPRGYGFIVKTARVYAEHKAPNRAALMRAQALSNDHADVWGLAYDFVNYYNALEYPEALRRTVYMNLLDRLAANGNIASAEKVHTDISEWASSREDKSLTAWLLHTGSRIDVRRQDLFRARDRARDALKLYEALEDRPKIAELHNHLAGIELQDGNSQAALDAATLAVEFGTVDTEDGRKAVLPAVLATAEQVRGLIARRDNKLEDAVKHFQAANQVSGQTGLAAIALDSGLSYGEALLASGQTDKGREALRRVLAIAQQLRNSVRERQTAELLAQAEGQLGNFAEALPLAQRVLQLSQQLNFDHLLPIDFYNVGFFLFMTDKPSEAVAFFKQAEQRVGSLGKHPVVKELHYFKGLAHLRSGDLEGAKSSLRTSLRPIQEAKDWRKMCSSLANLSGIEERQGNREVAKRLLTDAIGFAKQANLKEERKQLKKRLEALG